MPTAWPGDQAPSDVVRALPPELGPDAVAVLEGISYMYSNGKGDVPASSIGGFVHEDTRLLNRWELTLNGAPLLALDSNTVDHYSAAFFLTNDDLPGLSADTVGVRRQRFVGDGMHERIDLQSFAEEPISIQVRLAVGTDFADILEIKETVRDRSAQITHAHAPDGSRLKFLYRNGSVELETQVLVDPAASRIDGDDLVWDLRLEPHHLWGCELTVPARYGPDYTLPMRRQLGEVFHGDAEDPARRWRAAAPVLRSDSELLRDVFEKSAQDLVSLRVQSV